MSAYESQLIEICIKRFPQVTGLEKCNIGGQKIVFKGQHQVYGKIALKLLEIKSDNSKSRALRELEIASILKDKHFAELYEFNFIENDGVKYIYIIEEFIDGETLRDMLICKGCLGIQETLYIGKEILIALNEINNYKLVHRDIKPENIMISTNRVVILDFGIARDLEKESLTADMAFFGPMTVGYAAPEQIKNQKKLICNRTDLFSWGVVMYECLKGYNPFGEGCKTKEAIMIKSLNYNPPKLECSPQILSDMIYNCLQKTVHRRPVSSKYMLDLLSEVE